MDLWENRGSCQKSGDGDPSPEQLHLTRLIQALRPIQRLFLFDYLMLPYWFRVTEVAGRASMALDTVTSPENILATSAQ